VTAADDRNPALARYVIGLVVAAAAVLAPAVVLSARVRNGDHLLGAALLGVALLAAYRFPVHLTDKTKVSVDTAILVAAVLLLPPGLAIAMAGVTAAAHELVDRAPWQQGVFNAAQTTVYVAAGAWVFRAIAGPGSPPLRADPLGLDYLSLRTRAELRVTTRATAGALAALRARLGSPPGAAEPGHGGGRGLSRGRGPGLSLGRGCMPPKRSVGRRRRLPEHPRAPRAPPRGRIASTRAGALLIPVSPLAAPDPARQARRLAETSNP
jgi:hypothetical protein